MNKISKIIIHTLAIIILIISFIMLFNFYTKDYGLLSGIFVDFTVACFATVMYYVIIFVAIYIYSNIFKKNSNKPLPEYNTEETKQWHGITLGSKPELGFEKQANFMVNWFLILPFSLFCLWMIVGRYLRLAGAWIDIVFAILTFAIILGPLIFTGYYLFVKIFFKKTIAFPFLWGELYSKSINAPTIQILVAVLYSIIFIASLLTLLAVIFR